MFTHPPKIETKLLACVVLLTAPACDSRDVPDPIIGAWESTERIGSEHNEMEIEGDLEGEATIYFYLDGEAYFADFDVVAEPKGGGDYELELDCRGSCSDLDFKADCELDGDELECEGDGLWQEYELVWEAQ